jgi:hypothetical protein
MVRWHPAPPVRRCLGLTGTVRCRVAPARGGGAPMSRSDVLSALLSALTLLRCLDDAHPPRAPPCPCEHAPMSPLLANAPPPRGCAAHNLLAASLVLAAAVARRVVGCRFGVLPARPLPWSLALRLPSALRRRPSGPAVHHGGRGADPAPALCRLCAHLLRVGQGASLHPSSPPSRRWGTPGVLIAAPQTPLGIFGQEMFHGGCFTGGGVRRAVNLGARLFRVEPGTGDRAQEWEARCICTGLLRRSL